MQRSIWHRQNGPAFYKQKVDIEIPKPLVDWVVFSIGCSLGRAIRMITDIHLHYGGDNFNGEKYWVIQRDLGLDLIGFNEYEGEGPDGGSDRFAIYTGIDPGNQTTYYSVFELEGVLVNNALIPLYTQRLA